jgi:hypothetical protein
VSGFSNPIIGGGGSLVYPSIHSPGFDVASPTSSAIPSWGILKNGLAYFYGLVLSGGGTITGPDYVISPTGIFFYSGTPALGNLIVSIAGAAGIDSQGNVYPEGFDVTVGVIPGGLLAAGSVPASAVNFTARGIGGITTTTAGTAPTGAKAGDLWIDTAAGNALYQYSGSAWVLYPFSAAALAVGAALTNIGAAGVTSTYLASGVALANIGAAGLTSAYLAAGTALSNLSAGSITASLLAASAALGNIGAGGITASYIATNAIVAGAIAANAVTAGTIAAGAVVTASIAAGAVTAAQIAANTITAAQIAANTITASQIAAGTITSAQIAAGTITAADLISGIVVAGIVNATTITGASIVADGTAGEVLIYSGTPALGNLIGSWSGAAGADSFGNAYPAGLYVNPGAGTFAALQAQSETLNPGPLLLYGNPVTVVVYLTGSGNWTCPTGVTSVLAECIGSGAGGGGTSGGAGGGGEYAAEPALAVTPASLYAYVVAAGGAGGTSGANGSNGSNTTFAGTSVTVTAHGGHLGAGAGSGTGGLGGSGSTNTTHYSGGAGGSGGGGGSLGGGGGGGSGGISSAGNSGHNYSGASGGAGAAAVSGGGSGGAGGASGNGVAGGAPGGGGGGGGSSGNGAAGHAGQIRLTYTPSGSSELVASLASAAGIDPNTSTAYPGPGLGLAAVGTPAALAGFAAIFADSNDNLGFVGGADGQHYDTGKVTRYTAGQTVSSTTPAAVVWGSGSNPLVAAGVYHVYGHMLCTMGATTAAAVFTFTTTGTVGSMRCLYYAIENVSILASNFITALASTMSTGSIPNGTAGQFFFDGIIVVTAPGNLGLEVQEGTSGDTWTLNSQSWMVVEPLVA